MFNWKKVYFCSICCALVAFSTPTITNAYTLTKPEGVQVIRYGEEDLGVDRWFLGEVELEAYTISDGLGTRALPIGETYGWKNKGPGGLTSPSIWTDIPRAYLGASNTTAAGVLAFGGGYFYGRSWEPEASQRYQTRNLEGYVNLQAVGAYAFESVPERTDGPSEITVPDKCSQIEEYAWKNCTFLKKVTFLCPNITYMSPLAFDGCYDTLEEVRIVAAENTTEQGLKQNIVSLKSAGQQAGLPENPKDWTESERNNLNSAVPVNTVTDFVATFEGHGFSWTIEDAEDGNGRFIVLRKSPLSVNNNSVDIAEKENVLIDKQVYSSHDQSILTEDLKITAPDGTELAASDYDIYLRWVKDGETSEWVKYVDKDSLKVRDAGTYTIQYVVRYKGDNPDLKSNPEGLNVTEDENGGIQIEISENEDSSKPTEVSEPPVEPQESNEDDISNSESENQSEDDSQTPDSSSEGGGDGQGQGNGPLEEEEEEI